MSESSKLMPWKTPNSVPCPGGPIKGLYVGYPLLPKQSRATLAACPSQRAACASSHRSRRSRRAGFRFRSRDDAMGPFFLHPCRVIAEACGVSKRTIHRWIRFHGLPVFHLPGGALCTTLTFLNDWARDRMEVSSGRRPFFHTRGTVSVVWQKASRNTYVLGASFSVPPCQ